MQIKWIELNGFKSFPEKIKIELKEGITCFVGPNGAGKSNIADAFRWILGEHNPRSLRGEKMEEIIFQGSSSKKEKGLAEVTVMLKLKNESTNGDESEFEEVEIKRRLYRTGESYFIINGKQSRLKDIKEIFISEGVDIRNYAIIDQIKINEILSKPSQRKALLEDCAGISIYKFKKSEAEGKLQSAKENLQRVEDIISEVKKQLSLLEKQAKKAEKYKKIIEELKNLELKVSKKESSILLKEIENLNNEIKTLENRQLLMNEKISKNIEKLEYLKEKITKTEISIQNMENQLKDAEVEKLNTEKSIALLIQERKNKEEQILKLEEEELLSNNEIKKFKEDLKKALFDSEEIEKNVERLQKEIIDYEQALLDSDKETAEFEGQIDKQRKSLFNLSTELASKRNYLQSLKKSFEMSQNRINSLQQKLEETHRKIDYFQKDYEKLKENINTLRETLYGENAEIEKLQKELSDIEKIMEEKTRLIIEKKKKEAILAGKLESLKTEIWEDDKKNKLFFEIIEVKPEVEQIIENFLGEKLKASLIENLDDIEKTEEKKFYFLKNMPLKEGSSEKVIKDFELKKFSDFVTVKIEGIDKNIFQNIFLVEDLKKALEIKKEIPEATFLTTKGEVIFPDGFIKKGKEKSLFKKMRIFEELQAEKLEISENIDRLQKECEKIKTLKEQLKKKIENKRIEISQINREIFQNEERRKSILKEMEATKQRAKYMENEQKAIQDESAHNLELIEKTKSEIDYISYSIQDVEEKIEEIKKRREDILKINREKRETLYSKRIELSTLKERLKNKKDEINKTDEQIKKLSQRKNKAVEEIEKNKTRIFQIEKDIHEKEDKIKALSLKIEDNNRKKENQLLELKKDKNSYDQIEREYQQLNKELQHITTLIGQKNAILKENTIKLENLWKEIYNLYGIDIIKETIEPVVDSEALKGRISQLKSQLKEIGPVDMEILKEYEEVKERHIFLVNQQKDLITSIEELTEAIKKINLLTRKKLRETFEALKEKFNTIFNELFGGGKVEIFFTDESDILNSDIDINVHPPGKKSTNINLLSGGEKTLTAIAFVFACLSIRPSPLCILDEVDASLDEPNSIRFRNLIKDFSNKTHFLIITHNKLIMEYADYIYGVTMQEEGVSSIISLKLSEAEVYA